MVVHVLDRYYLAITVLITIGYQCLGFAIAWTLQFDKITDFTGGSNFFILALVTLLMGNAFHARNIIASVCVMVWAARLGGFLLFRVLKTGSDNRFDEMRSKFFAFMGFWVGQILWVWVVSLPTVILNSPAVSEYASGGDNPKFGTATDIIGLVFFAVGLFWEATGDIQKYLYKSSNPPKGKPCTKGLWRFSRHPPYFGEILLHWGLWLLCLAPSSNGSVRGGAKAAQYASIVAPILTILLLMFLSGLPTAEKPTAKKHFLSSYGDSSSSSAQSFTPENSHWQDYKHYLVRTSIIIPIPPSVYRPLPEWIKRSVLLDLPMYRFDERTDGEEALKKQREEEA